MSKRVYTTRTVAGVPVTVTVAGHELAVLAGRRSGPQAAPGRLRVNRLSGTAAVAVHVACLAFPQSQALRRRVPRRSFGSTLARTVLAVAGSHGRRAGALNPVCVSGVVRRRRGMGIECRQQRTRCGRRLRAGAPSCAQARSLKADAARLE